MGPTGRQTPAEAERQRINALLDAQDTRYRESLGGQQIVPNGPLLTGRSQPIDITGYNPLSYLNLYGTPTTTTSLGVQTAPSTVMLNGGATNQPIRSETTPVAVAPVDKPRSNDPVVLTPAAPVNTATVSARPQLTPNVQVNNSFDYNRATPCEIMPNGQCRESTNPNDVFLKGYMANMNKNGGESLGDVARRGAFYGRTVEQQLGAEQSDNDKLAYANALNSPEAMAEVTRLMKGGNMSLDTAKSIVSDNVLQQLGSHRARALYALPKAQQALDAQRNTSLGMSYATGTPDTPLDYLGLGSSGVSMIDPTNSSATVGGRMFNNLSQGAMEEVYRQYPLPQSMVDAGRTALASQGKVAADMQLEQLKQSSALERQRAKSAVDYQIAALEARSRALQKTGGAGNPEKDQIDLQLKRTQLEKANLELDGMRDTVDSTGGK